MTVTEEAEKVQPSIAAAEADNKAQTAEIKHNVENYKRPKPSMKLKISRTKASRAEMLK